MELLTTGLRKQATQVVHRAEAYIAYFKQVKSRKPDHVTLSQAQWKILRASLTQNKHTLRNLTIQGVPVEVDDG